MAETDHVTAPAPHAQDAAPHSPLSPEQLSALKPVIDDWVRESIRKDPKFVADTILPGLGPAIRKTVSDSFRLLIEQVNDAMDYSLSREGLKWRIEAARSGKSFAEIALYNTLIYRVEQVLLIHRKTGLMITHVTADGDTESHADLVSSMLTAIQDFARDAFDTAEGEVLKTMEVGELKVWIHGGPHVLLAAVMRGNAPSEFRGRLDQAIEDIQLGFARPLDAFNGDSSELEGTRTILHSCLLEDRRRPRKSLPLLIALLTLLLAGAGTLVTLEIRDRMRWARYVETLDQTPGVIVSEVYRRGRQYSLTGLRDPLSGDPLASLAAQGMDTNRISFKWEAYNALSEEFVLARAYEALNPPESVSLSLVGGYLAARGSAPREWIREARLLSKALPGILDFDEQELVDLDTSEYEILVWEFKEKSYQTTRERIESLVLDFSPARQREGGALAEDLELLRNLIVKLGGIARYLNKRFAVEVVGLVQDSSGANSATRDAARNANSLKDSLVGGGIADVKITAKFEQTQTRYEQTSPTIVRIVELSERD